MQDKQGNTALHLAAKGGHAGVVRLLLTQGSPWSVDAQTLAVIKNKAGQVALHCAALSGCQQCIAALQTAAPTTASALDKHGRTPVQLAVKRNFQVCLPEFSKVGSVSGHGDVANHESACNRVGVQRQWPCKEGSCRQEVHAGWLFKSN